MLSVRSRGRVWPWFVVMVAIVVAIAAFVVPLPYYVDGPGVVRATQSRVSVSGHPAYESKGQIFFTTVSERRATPYLLLQAWLDEAIDTLPEKVATPTGDRDAERRAEQQQMDRSKLTSIEVAFRVLDLPLTITGTGAFINEVGKDYPRPPSCAPATSSRRSTDRPSPSSATCAPCLPTSRSVRWSSWRCAATGRRPT